MNTDQHSSASKTPTSEADAAFAQIPEISKAQAKRLGVEILWNEEGFGMWVRGDMLAECLTAEEVQVWLDGFDCGGVSDSAPAALLSELIAAEQIINALVGYLSDTQKDSLREACIAMGVAGQQAATRSNERRAAIINARSLAGEA